VVLVFEMIFLGKKQSWKVKLSIVVVCAGVTMATVHDLSVNLLGMCLAAGAVFSAALYQLWAGSKQREFSVNANQVWGIAW